MALAQTAHANRVEGLDGRTSRRPVCSPAFGLPPQLTPSPLVLLHSWGQQKEPGRAVQVGEFYCPHLCRFEFNCALICVCVAELH